MTWPVVSKLALPNSNSAAPLACRTSWKSGSVKPTTKPWPGSSPDMAARQPRASSCPNGAAKTILNSRNSIGRNFNAS